ncbi:Mitochondrial inner membrane protease subunit 2 [Linum grandiflorum]
MAAREVLVSAAKKFFLLGIIGIPVTDRLASVVPVRGQSMSTTLNPDSDSIFDDRVLVEKLSLRRYSFSHGDVVVFRSPVDHKEKLVKRIIGLPGDWVGTPHTYDVVKVPEGHCWVEGDNMIPSMDSRSFGPIPLGLASGRVVRIVWPPQRMGKVERRVPEGRLCPSG